MAPEYPFAPKSNAHLKPGQFWSIPLEDGRFACGRVVAVPAFGASDRRGVAVGVMDWIGDAPPTVADLPGRGVLAQGLTRVEAITSTGGEVLGIRELDLDDIVPIDPTDHREGVTQTLWGWAKLSETAADCLRDR